MGVKISQGGMEGAGGRRGRLSDRDKRGWYPKSSGIRGGCFPIVATGSHHD